MRVAIACSLASVLLLAGACTTVNHQTARLEAAQTLANAETTDYTVAEAMGRQSASWGDRWTAANLYERAVDKQNTVTGRFNLAHKYEQTGRLAEAAALYRGLIRDAQFVWGVTGVDRRNPAAPLTHFNIADESARRYAALQARLTYAANTGAGAAAATEAGTPVAAVVGGTGPVVAERRISDAEAMSRDAAANPG